MIFYGCVISQSGNTDRLILTDIRQSNLYSIIQNYNEDFLVKTSGDFKTGINDVEDITFTSKVDGYISGYIGNAGGGNMSLNINGNTVQTVSINHTVSIPKTRINIGDTVNIKSGIYYWTFIILFTD